MELEFENAGYNEVADHLTDTVDLWLLKYDSTVNRNKGGKQCGGEIVTPILKDENKSWQELEMVCNMLKDLKATAEDLAGGHIHFGAQILGSNTSYWLNMIKLWAIYEKIIYRFSFGDKIGPRNNMKGYAAPISNTLYDLIPNLAHQNLEFSGLIGSLPRNNRYHALNFNNVKSGEYSSDKNTLEVRCPNSSINPIVWQNNVNLFGKLFLYCKSGQFDYDFIEGKLRQYSVKDNIYELYQEIYLQEALELSDLIFSNNLDKVYFLKQYLKSFEQPRKKEDNVRHIKL